MINQEKHNFYNSSTDLFFSKYFNPAILMTALFIFLCLMGNKTSKFRYGLVQFKSNINPQNSILKSDPQLYKTLFKNQKWILDNGKCKQYRIEQIFLQLDTISIQILNMNANNIQDIPVTIARINFDMLKSLKISGNNISSIQSLVFLKADKLVQLQLSWNIITCSKIFRKCHFPKLKFLNLEQNYFTQLGQDLSECNFPQLRQLCLQNDKKARPLCHNFLRLASKWESNELYQIVCYSSKRIVSPEKLNKLKQKYVTLKCYRSKKQTK